MARGCITTGRGTTIRGGGGLSVRIRLGWRAGVRCFRIFPAALATDAGHLATIPDPLGSTTTQTYDAASRLLTQTDPLGRTTQFAYDALSRLITVVDPLNHATHFSYDPNENLLTVSS
jgi:YD repeat-containing protein